MSAYRSTVPTRLLLRLELTVDAVAQQQMSKMQVRVFQLEYFPDCFVAGQPFNDGLK